MSPLRGFAGVVYVTGPQELARALRSIRENEAEEPAAYFCLDKQIPRWRRLLDLRKQASSRVDVD
jgi:hypothetical protein